MRRISQTLSPPNAYSGPLMVICKKKLCYATSRGEWPSKQNTLIAETILAEPGPQSGFDVWGAKCIFKGKDFVFIICLKQIFLRTTKFGGTIKIWG